ncbi:MAG: cytochrome C oxidase assembly protein [Sulfitobacter sp.]
MNMRVEHEIHSRRKGRNVGIGLMLGAFVVLVMVLTFVKITQTDFTKAARDAAAASAEQQQVNQ